jgi:hypothetical protein
MIWSSNMSKAFINNIIYSIPCHQSNIISKKLCLQLKKRTKKQKYLWPLWKNNNSILQKGNKIVLLITNRSILKKFNNKTII